MTAEDRIAEVRAWALNREQHLVGRLREQGPTVTERIELAAERRTLRAVLRMLEREDAP